MSTKNIEHLQVDLVNDVSETSQQNVGKRSQQKVDKVTKQKVDETSEQNVIKTSQQTVVKTSQQTVVKTSQQKVDETSEQNSDETSEQNDVKITKPLPMKKVVFLSGDLAWARLGSAPFWPCIVLSETEVDPNMLSQENEKDKTFFVQVTFKSNHFYCNG